ncbi:hypothetical protein CC77DRAFT_794394 [Alternaria alternata]|uniref:Uncharacterized protein n=1 Tax=Alternaria alternata TaxID=5599 RepID=A0A177DR14_ALTAL|nr:hypothetical protein CC77DRAFT_794394 [Alternaria alternata]OAG22274.1 hypothetical protein CC77DRAFT_794394 [Alternaria alternata]
MCDPPSRCAKSCGCGFWRTPVEVSALSWLAILRPPLFHITYSPSNASCLVHGDVSFSVPHSQCLSSARSVFHVGSHTVLHSLEVCSSFTDMHATPWCTYGFRARSLATVLLLQLPKYWLPKTTPTARVLLLSIPIGNAWVQWCGVRPGIKDPLTSAAKHQSFSFPSGLTYRIRLDVHNMSKLIDIRFRRSTYRRLLGRIF